MSFSSSSSSFPRSSLCFGVGFGFAAGCLSCPRFSKFLVMTTVESFTASAMGLTVGCFAPSPEAALALGPSLMTVFIVFGGYYVNADNTPLVFRWIPNASLIRWYGIRWYPLGLPWTTEA